MSSFSIYPSLLFDVFLGFASSLLLASEGSDDIFDLTNPKTNNDGIATVEIEAKKKRATSVIARATIEGEIQIDEFTITVT